MSTSGRYQLIAAEVSLFSGKARAYLRHKQIPFEEVLPTRKVLEQVVKPRTGLKMIPVLISDDDIAVQDTTAIIDFCEARFAARGVYPPTPRQHLAALLLELWGDEWLVLPAMHYRWHYKRSNFLPVVRQLGRLMAPRLPARLQPLAGLPLAVYFGGAYGPILGVTKANRSTIESHYEAFLRAFDRHLVDYPYLFGGCPSIGDFGLMGPLYAHLYRDPYSGRLMHRLAPRVADWVERMNHPGRTLGRWCAHDEVPVTLDPIFKALFNDAWPVVEASVAAVDAWRQNHPGSPRLPRFVGTHEFSLDGVVASRRAQSLTQWMAQRPLGYYRDLTGPMRSKVDAWLARVGGQRAMALVVPTWVERRADNRLYPRASPLGESLASGHGSGAIRSEP